MCPIKTTAVVLLLLYVGGFGREKSNTTQVPGSG